MKLSGTNLKILVIRLRYIGDVVLAVPFLRQLRRDLPNAEITLMTGPAAYPAVQDCPFVDNIIIYDKKKRHSGLLDRIRFIGELRAHGFHVSFILQRSFSSAFYAFMAGIPLRVGFDTEGRGFMLNRKVFYDKNQYEADAFMENLRILGLGREDRELGTFHREPSLEGIGRFLEHLDRRRNQGNSLGFVVINPGPKGSPKSWTAEGFAEVARRIMVEHGLDVVVTWGPGEGDAAGAIMNLLPGAAENSKGSGARAFVAPPTDIPELITLLRGSRMMVTTDTGPLHMAAANGIPTVTVFGPTNPVKWSPRDSGLHAWIKDFPSCWPCDYNRCTRNWQCMKGLRPDRVYQSIHQILNGSARREDLGPHHRVINFKALEKFGSKRNILVIETSSVGEVVLITPALRALRSAFPEARITALVIPSTRDVLEGLDTIDEIICYDKFGKHRNAREAMNFIMELRQRRYDLVLLLHRSFRSAVVSFLTKAPDRVGVATEGRGFLVTESVPNRGNSFQHEIERNNDIIRSVGIEPVSNELEFHIPSRARTFAQSFLESKGAESALIAGLYPGAGWPSKRWRVSNFAALGRQLLDRGLCEKVMILWGPGEEELARSLEEQLGSGCFMAPGTSLKELAALMSRCRVLVTNDTGPMHMATALKVPQVVLMGPTHPRRWGPYTGPARILYTGQECGPCNQRTCPSCVCMDSITVESCLQAAMSLLGNSGGNN